MFRTETKVGMFSFNFGLLSLDLSDVIATLVQSNLSMTKIAETVMDISVLKSVCEDQYNQK